MCMSIDKQQFVNESASDAQTHQQVDDLGAFFTRFFKIIQLHKWLFLSVFFIVLALVLLYAFNQPRIYQSNYEVFYNETMREYVNLDRAPVVKSDFDKNYWLRAMTSNDLMQMTLENSGLPYSITQLKNIIRVGIIDKRKEDRIPVYFVSISTEEKLHIPILIRAYVKGLNQMLVQNQVQNSERLLLYLTEQLKQNNAKLNQIDITIRGNAYSSGIELIDFEKVNATLDRFRADLLNARVNLSSVMSARMRTEQELATLDGTIVNESAFSEPLKVQLMNLEVDLARSLTRNKEDHPEVKQIRRNIEQISTMIRDTIQQRMEIRSLVQNPVKAQLMAKLMELKISEVSEETKVRSLEKIIAELELKTLPGAVNEEQQQNLRNREMISLTIKQLNDKLIETQTMSHGSLSRFVFIDDPSSVFLSNKGLLFYIILALMLGIVAAAALVFLYDLLDDRLMLIEDYERFYRIPLLGVVKHYRDNENYLITPASYYKNQSSSEISTLVMNIRQLQKTKSIKNIVISSPDRHEGKSLVSLKIASELANKNQKVLLIDMDFFSPKLSVKIDPEVNVGLCNYIAGEKSLDEVIQKTDLANLHFINAGTFDGQKELLYGNEKLKTAIENLKSSYDLVIFDTPAAIYIPDVVEFFDNIDAIFIIARLRRTTRKLLDRLLKVIQPYQNKVIYTILNDFYLSGKNIDYNYYGYNYQSYEDNSGVNDVDKLRRPSKSIVFLIGIALMALSVFGFMLYRYFANNNADSKAYTENQFNDSDIETNSLNIEPSAFIFSDSIVVDEFTTLTALSQKYYNNTVFWVYIYIANKPNIETYDSLRVGSKLYIPSNDNFDMSSNEALDKAKEIEKKIFAGVL